MAGQFNGCAAQIYPQAIYYHCASHQLNLALSKTTNIREVQVMISAVTSLGLFFKYRPKRQRHLETAYNKELCVRLGGSNDIQPWKILMTCILPYVTVLMILHATKMVYGIVKLLLKLMGFLIALLNQVLLLLLKSIFFHQAFKCPPSGFNYGFTLCVQTD